MSREKPNTVKEPFRSLALPEANAECSANIVKGTLGREREKPRGAQCPACTMKVLLHCLECRVQITGCLCVEYARFGNDVAWQRAVARWGEEAARQRAESAGLWIPGR